MSYIVSIVRPVAQVDTNSVESDGLVPASIRFVRGLRIGEFAPGQMIRAEDQDGQVMDAEIVRVEGSVVLLRLEMDTARSFAGESSFETVAYQVDTPVGSTRGDAGSAREDAGNPTFLYT